jgi:transcriptional regulator with XRE-family HTH domain
MANMASESVANMPHGKPLGERLRIARKRSGLGATELSELAGLDRATVHRIETGTTPNPGLMTLLAIQQALGLPSLELLLMGEPEFGSTELASRDSG